MFQVQLLCSYKYTFCYILLLALLLFRACGGLTEACFQGSLRALVQALLMFGACGGLMEACLQGGLRAPVQALLMFGARGGRILPETI